MATPLRLPAVLGGDLLTADGTWHVLFSEDLAAAVTGPQRDGLSAAAASALRALVRTGEAARLSSATETSWRAVCDLDGALVAVAVDPLRRQLGVGSPRFATEQALLWAADRLTGLDAEAREQRERLRGLVAAWQDAAVAGAPLSLAHALARAEVQHAWLADARDQRTAAWLEETARIAQRLHPQVRRYRASWRERASQWGLRWMAAHAPLRLHLLRFVAALPSLDHDAHGAAVVGLLAETLRRLQASDQRRDEGSRLPTWMVWALLVAAAAIRVLPVRWTAWSVRKAVRDVARTFIAGEDMIEAAPVLASLAASGRGATLDQLGELVVCEAEADTYQQRVEALIDAVATPSGEPPRNAAGIPQGHVSIKVSALCADYDPDDVEGTWQRVGPRLTALAARAQRGGVFLNLDAEHYPVRDLTWQMLQRLLGQPQFGQWRDCGIVIQAYLRDAAEHLNDIVAFGRRRGVRMPLRLVKGAYWDAETVEADAHDHPAPQFLDKSETDAMFQVLCAEILRHGEAVQLCIGSHNLRDHAAAEAMRALWYTQAPPIEHQALHMTYEGLSVGMAEHGWVVRNYVPVGSLLVGMAYLVRRILENSSQVGVLTAARDGVALDALLVSPWASLAEDRAVRRDPQLLAVPRGALPEMINVAPLQLFRRRHRAVFEVALAAPLPAVAPDRDRHGPPLVVASPSHHDHVLAALSTDTPDDVAAAVQRAEATVDWEASDRERKVRAVVLLRAAEQLRCERPQWAAWIVHESGKARAEALGDVDEAIDFMQFYAREALQLDAAALPRGVVAVIAPWNFPLAIPCGMASAAYAAGNAVVVKAAEQTPLIVAQWLKLMARVGASGGSLQAVVGDGATVGAALVAQPQVAGLVFTGSRGVGCHLHSALAGRVVAGVPALCITEMGGKNAVVVTATADLDEAISGCLRAAFGHAGQKCSAASRILVDAQIADAFAQRFAHAARDLTVGPGERAGTRVNPLISATDAERLREAAVQVCREVVAAGGEVLLDRTDLRAEPALQHAHAVGPLVVRLPAAAARDPASFAQTELFGPVVHIIAYATLDEAAALWADTPYALTGGIYAQSQDEIDALVAVAHVGNLYINRSITGARVAVEPFGGFRMSGTGPKAGGSGYVEAFVRWRAAFGALDPEACALLAGDVPAPSADQGAETDHHDSTHAAAIDPVAWGRVATADLPLPRDALLAWCRVARWCAANLHGWATQGVPTRSIPGQITHNVWRQPRGLVAVLAGRRAIGAHAAAHVATALACGNPVRVIACSASAAEAWQTLRATLHTQLGQLPPLEVEAVSTRVALEAHLADGDVATWVVDGPAAGWSRILPRAVAAASSHLRQILAEGQWPLPDQPAALAAVHRLPMTVAIHTMRHGAPLVEDSAATASLPT